MNFQKYSSPRIIHLLMLRALLSKIYRFEIPFLTVCLVKNMFGRSEGGGGGAWPHAPP